MLRIAGWPEGLGTNAETTRPQRVVTLAFWGEPFAWMVPRVETWLKPWAEFSTPSASGQATAFSLPDGARGRLEWKSEEGSAGLRYSATVSADSPLELNGIEFRVDLSRPAFVGGTALAESGAPVALARVRTAGPVLFRGQTPALRFQDATGNLAFDIGFDQPTAARCAQPF